MSNETQTCFSNKDINFRRYQYNDFVGKLDLTSFVPFTKYEDGSLKDLVLVFDRYNPETQGVYFNSSEDKDPLIKKSSLKLYIGVIIVLSVLVILLAILLFTKKCNSPPPQTPL